MQTITIKNIEDNLHTALKKIAKLNKRSLNNEIIYCIERYVKIKKIDPGLLTDKARKIRSKIEYSFSAQEIKKAINDGRR